MLSASRCDYFFSYISIWRECNLVRQWQDVASLTHSNFFLHSYSGHTSLGMLWIQHNENRQLFQNLIVLALGALTHLNVVTELYLNALLLAIATWLIILTSRRDLRPIPGSSTLPSRS